MAGTILSGPFFTELVLPFLLVFTLIFAILDKTKVLGDGKRQINAIIGFVVGLMLIAFPQARDLVVNLMPLLAVLAVIFLVFMILYAFASVGEEKVEIPSGLKWVMVGIFSLAIVIGLIIFSGAWDTLNNYMGGGGKGVVMNVFFVIVVIGGIVAVVASGKGEQKDI